MFFIGNLILDTSLQCTDSDNYCYSCCEDAVCLAKDQCQISWKRVCRFAWNSMLAIISISLISLILLIYMVFTSLEKREAIINIGLEIRK